MLLGRIARSLLAVGFVSGGLEALLNLKPAMEAAKPMVERGRVMLSAESTPDVGTMVQIDAAVRLVAGLMLTFGRAPRAAAAALAVSLVPTTVAGHAFWAADDAAERRAQQRHFLENAGLLGGLLLAASATDGSRKPRSSQG
ncbi:MAG: DoxX family membrane protein [Pseudonocardiaceae bacterium]